MSEQTYKLISDKVFPLLLVLLAGTGYLLRLPSEFCAGIGAAGLVAYRNGDAKSPQS
ncbi:hypothetical protein [Phenylobacterium sp.]|uniref:hypothetical protein n=1 Tax=Phenylobacterium sp. TaxID=1871053 RepID=UPI00261DB028|nr:hypothetical protein [Phenylobacterium sp.]